MDDYITTDMDVAAYLMCLGHKVKTWSKGGRHFLQFESSNTLREDVQNFLNDVPLNKFKLRSYSETLRRLRMEVAISQREVSGHE